MADTSGTTVANTIPSSTSSSLSVAVPESRAWKYIYVMAGSAFTCIVAIILFYAFLSASTSFKWNAAKEIVQMYSTIDNSNQGVYVISKDTMASLSRQLSPAIITFAKKYTTDDTGKTRHYEIPMDSLRLFIQRTDLDTPADHRAYISLLVLVALCGGLGALVYIMNSFADFWGNGKLYTNWLAFYLVKPFIGMSLALAFYFIVGTNMLKTGITAGTSLNYLLAVAFMVGLFTDKAVTKLSNLFDAILTTNTKREDNMSSPPKPDPASVQSNTAKPADVTIADVDPATKQIKTTTDTTVILTGTGFAKDMTIASDNAATTISNLDITTGDTGIIKFTCNTTLAPGASVLLHIKDASGTVKANVTLTVVA